MQSESVSQPKVGKAEQPPLPHSVTPSPYRFIALESDAALDAMHADWTAHGLTFAQAPVRKEFGYTFVALDPDGHRLRVYVPEAA